ncbi:YopX family protein [Listeria booriae]|uniref:YopX family protein n=1 Tax=Listeria booriae TaxID=1552123 RepID=UPI001625CE41|nr:YopX family protein [Listeria booriae]MBC2104021.1 hypothetical protein [Listeria booriae]
MRPIEFRIYCEQNMEMLKVDYLHFDDEGELLLATSVDDVVPYLENQKDWHLMQYTGLKDKKGNRIFDGDIVRIDSLEVFNLTSNYNDTPVTGSCISKVEIIEGHTYVWLTPIIDGKKIRYGARLLLKGLSKYISCNVATGSVEVIGNIHDNPELLEEGAEE